MATRLYSINWCFTILIGLLAIAIPVVNAQTCPIIPYHLDGQELERNIQYDRFGRPAQVVHFTLGSRTLSPSELFFHRADDPDSTISFTEEWARDDYSWNDQDGLVYLRRWERMRGWVYLFGNYQQLAMRRLQKDRQGRVGERLRVQFSIVNRGDKAVPLGFLDLPAHVYPDKHQWLIAPGDTIEVGVKVELLAGEQQLLLHLHHGNGSIPLTISTYGYHVRSDDLQSTIGMMCPSSFHYFRTGEETLLEVADPRSGEVLARYPVHADRSVIDLARAGLKELEFCARDHSAGTVSCTTVAVE